MSRGKGPGGGGRRPPVKGKNAQGKGAHGASARGKAAKGAQKKTTPSRTARKVVFDAPAPAPEQPRTFRLGVFAGATPGKWADIWKTRMPQVPIELLPTDGAEPVAVDTLDARLVRLPIDESELHVIRLYEELPVVVASTDSHLLAADELDAADLAGEVLLTSEQDVLELDLPGTASSAYGAVPTTADLIATVATGAGIAIVPMSLARLHHRKDVEYRVLRDGPISSVAFAWPRGRTTDDVETFVGIIRGRTANSSR